MLRSLESHSLACWTIHTLTTVRLEVRSEVAPDYPAYEAGASLTMLADQKWSQHGDVRPAILLTKEVHRFLCVAGMVAPPGFSPGTVSI